MKRIATILLCVMLMFSSSFVILVINGKIITEEMQKLNPPYNPTNNHFGNSLCISGNTMVVGANWEEIDGVNFVGAAYIYQLDDNNNWDMAKKLTVPDGKHWDHFGHSVSIDSDTVVVGAYRYGSAFIFERDFGGVGNWGLVKNITASDGEVDDSFGWAVSICKDTIVIGAITTDIDTEEDIGSVYVFNRNEGGVNNWGEVKKITASDGISGNHFGTSVSISDDTVVVRSPIGNEDDLNPESYAYIFERNNSGIESWGQVKKITVPDVSLNGNYGSTVSISGDIIVIGADKANVSGNTWQGSVYVFERDFGGIGNWGETTQLFALDGEKYDTFGQSVSISGDSIIVGAPGDDYLNDIGQNEWSQGSVYIYKRSSHDSGDWINTDKITASDGDSSDNFGYSVSLNDDLFVVGAPYAHKSETNDNKGYAYVFNLIFAPPIINDTVITSVNEDSEYRMYLEIIDDCSNDKWSLWTDADFLRVTPTGVVIGTANNTNVGQWTVNISVDDGFEGLDWRNFTLTVNNVEPVILTDNVILAIENVYYSVNYSSSDDNQGDITWSAQTNSEWLNINPSTGELYGIPTSNHIGEYWVCVIVDDGNGGNSSTNFTLEVQIDSDQDQIPDLEDDDDDGDGVPDDIDSEPLNPDVGEVVDEPEDPEEEGSNYIWIIIILVVVGIAGAALFLRMRSKPEVPEEMEELAEQNQ